MIYACSTDYLTRLFITEIEGFFNLLFSHFLTLFPLDAPETKEEVLKLVQIITTSNEQPSTRYRMYVRIIREPHPSNLVFLSLSNLFNALPRRSGLRLLVNEALVHTAAAQDDIEQLQLSPPEVEKWLSEWEISQEEKSTYLKTLVDTFSYDP